MKIKSCLLCSIALFVTCFLPSEIIVEEKFDLYTDSLIGKNGGKGFRTKWENLKNSESGSIMTEPGKATSNTARPAIAWRTTLINLAEHPVIYFRSKMKVTRSPTEPFFASNLLMFSATNYFTLGVTSLKKPFFLIWVSESGEKKEKYFGLKGEESEVDFILKIETPSEGDSKASIWFNTSDESVEPEATVGFKVNEKIIRSMMIGFFDTQKSAAENQGDVEWTLLRMATTWAEVMQ